MKMTTKNIINWVLAGLVAFVFIRSAFGKLTSSEGVLKITDFIGPDANKVMILACIEICAVILFIIPRTAILGTLLLVAYMGGAIATNLELAKPLISPIMVSTFVWIVALVRNPELSQKFLGKKINTTTISKEKNSLFIK